LQLRQKQKETENTSFELINQKFQVLLQIDDLTHRDLNRNNQLDIYEGINHPIEMRINDLLSQMNLKKWQV